MRLSISKFLLSILLTLMAMAPAMQAGTAQDSTPAADGPAVHFSLHAIGDFENNYFDDVEVEPNGTVELEVMVVNWLTEPVDLRLYAANGHNAVNGGFRAGGPNEELVGTAAWMNVSESELSLGPEERRVVSFTVTVPERTDPGQYISALVVETADPLAIPGQDSIDHNVRYSLSVGILVPGELNPSFELGDPALNGTVLDIPISNTGNVLVQPAGDITLLDGNGEVILTSDLELGSIYGGNETTISLGLPAALPEADYTLTLNLADENSDVSASLENASVEYVPQEIAAEPTVTLVSVDITPNAEDITYADVAITLQNDGEQVPVNVILNVYRDGELLEEANLATNQVFVSGENEFSLRYLPEGTWEPGTHTFSLVVVGVDPESGQESTLFETEIESEIVVP